MQLGNVAIDVVVDDDARYVLVELLYFVHCANDVVGRVFVFEVTGCFIDSEWLWLDHDSDV